MSHKSGHIIIDGLVAAGRFCMRAIRFLLGRRAD